MGSWKKKFLLSVLLTSFLSTGPAFAAQNFKDVSSTYWAADTIQWAAEMNMINGYPDGTFQPNKQVSEAEFLAMLIKFYAKDIEPTKIKTHWADDYYFFAAEYNYITSLSNRDTPILRQTVAEILCGANGKNYTGEQAVQYLLAKEWISGKVAGAATVPSFAGEDPLTRAEAVAFIKKAYDGGLIELKKRPIESSNPNEIPFMD
ncbi:S-layer homology domain-containing protein [Ammoniphilus resinae]|uniref:SLH domain-containing protein n=1 Tax=Ammoniphilus resinae TaxID=861532 RepID=A0ABS4GN59_9BACL|nr:S-layer homology domain-containing protein [Ammoniphilus resinae]MBP1931713.1 hypothetical protein [Ammoniphilus resinae]